MDRPRRPGSHSPVTVATFADPVAAHLARSRLEAEGVSAFVADEHLAWSGWMGVTAAGGVALQVWPDDAGRAAQVLAALERGEYALAEEPEPRCGEPAPACPRCTRAALQPDGSAWVLLSLGPLTLPIPWRRRRYRCLACGHRGFGAPRAPARP